MFWHYDCFGKGMMKKKKKKKDSALDSANTI